MQEIINNTREPNNLQIELVQGCNKKCEFCGIYSIKDIEKKYMTIEIAEKIVEQIALWIPKKRIEFAMHGEPLLNYNILKIINIFRKKLPECQLMLTTNGIILDNRIDRIKKLFDAGLNILAIDCYNNNYLERKKFLEKNISNDIDIFDYKDYNIYYYHDIKTKCIVLYENIVYIKDRRKKIYNHAGNCNPYYAEKYNYKIIKEPFKKKCTKPFREIIIKYNGNVVICCMDWKQENIIENIRDYKLKDIWYGEKLTNIRKKLFNRDRNIEPCKRCDFDGGFYQGFLLEPK